MQPLQLRLTVSGPTGPAEYVTECPILLGRLNHTGVQLRDLEVSRTHATLSSEGSALVVRDLDSGNGTIVVDGDARHVLRGTMVKVPSGSAELVLGATTVFARLEVPSYVLPDKALNATRLACRELRHARGHAALTSSHGAAEAPTELFRAIYQSVCTVRTAFQAIDSRTRTDRTLNAAQEALLLWTRELLYSLSHAANALQIDLHPSAASVGALLMPPDVEVNAPPRQLEPNPKASLDNPASPRAEWLPKRAPTLFDTSTPTDGTCGSI